MRQLIHHGLLQQDITRHSVLNLLPAARPLLRSEVQLQLAVPRLQHQKSPAKSGKVQQKQQYDRILFSKLRALRKQIADQADVPPFVVFSDATLIEMAQQLPQTRTEFLALSGVGQTKLTRYGDEFLDLIAEYLDQ